jgi:DNA (cytosine-5)-methyltransferase 1
MNVLDLFSGIGGFSLGLERAGMSTVAFCEIDPYARRVLAKHWPEVPCYDDVRTLTGERLRADGISVDVICGGFPCQDISSANAGRQTGLAGTKSGLWSEYARLIREVAPTWIVIENSPDLRTRGADRVLADLEDSDYSCWSFMVGAANAGAPHLRRRVWILGNANDQGKPTLTEHDETSGVSGACISAYANGVSAIRAAEPRTQCNPWADEPAISQVDDGLSTRLGRPQVRALGNAVVPAIPEMIGRAIMQAAA